MNGQQETTWRYERKFRLDQLLPEFVRHLILSHPAGFKPAFPGRWINNLYFDTITLAALHDNLAGLATREKKRLRWYGALFPAEPTPARQERKIRANQLGSKVFVNTEPLPFHSLSGLLSALDTAEPELQAVLLNRYYRTYYLSFDRKVRLTLDWELAFSSPQDAWPAKKLSYQLPGVVMELKYAPSNDELAEEIIQHFPFPITKSSKYVMGMELLLSLGMSQE